MIHSQLFQHLEGFEQNETSEEDNDGTDSSDIKLNDDTQSASDVVVSFFWNKQIIINLNGVIVRHLKSCDCALKNNPNYVTAFWIGLLSIIIVAALQKDRFLLSSWIYVGTISILSFALGKSTAKTWTLRNSQLDQTIVAVNNNHQKIKETRLRLSKWMGSVGVPPLRLLEDGECNPSKEVENHLQTMEQLTKAHVNLIQVLEDAMTALKLGTSLKLGLGRQSQNVVRVEQTAFARARKQKAIVPMALSMFRKRIYNILNRQLNLLLEIIEYSEDSMMHTDRNIEMEEVITCALLHSLKLDLCELLSEAVSRWMNGSEQIPKAVDKLLEQATLSAHEAETYLQSSIHNSCCTRHLGSTQEAATTTFSQQFSCMQNDTNALQAALLGCQESCVSEIEGDGIDNEIKAWWKHVHTIFSSLQNSMEQIDEQFLRANPSFEANGEESSRSIDDESSVSAHPIQSSSIRQEYASGGDKHITKSPDQYHQKPVTLVFSGISAPKRSSRKNRQSSSNDANHDNTRKGNNVFSDEFTLIDELQKHIKAMPPMEEIEMNPFDDPKTIAEVPSATSKSPPNNNNDDDELQKSSVYRRGTDNMLLENALFLGELKQSIPAFSSSLSRNEEEFAVG